MNVLYWLWADVKKSRPTQMLVIVLSNLMRFFTKKSFYHQWFFAVKRRAVFILGAMWIALVRGWRRDCVVGGMETRFQWRKAHNPYAKCEAFHIAPRLFFMFLFLSPFTIWQHCIIYPQEFSTEPKYRRSGEFGAGIKTKNGCDKITTVWCGEDKIRTCGRITPTAV